MNNENRKYYLKQSTTTCGLDEIQSIIYGGFSSRFWIYRKHMNTLENNKIPFYAWECVTLFLERDRQIDLVIKNETRMTQFLKLLSHHM